MRNYTPPIIAPGRQQQALTLIEMIAVLAILAIFAAALVPLLFRTMDKAAGDVESAALKSFGSGLQQTILRNRYIPGTNDWATVISAETGLNLAGVTVNGRNQPRYFLVDPNLAIGSSTSLPYVQGVFGVTGVTNARVLILSSIGPALTGAPASTAFDGIWNWVDDSTLPPTNSVFANIKKGEAVKVQRIDLSSLFVQLTLTTNNCTPGQLAYFSISTNGLSTAKTNVPATGLTNRFLISTVLGLYLSNGVATDSQQILTRNSSFAYEGDVWMNSIYGPPPSAGGGGGIGVSSTAYAIVTNFLAAPKNYGTGASNQADVVQAMIDFMNAYDNWASSKFTNATYKATALDKQGVLERATFGLCCSPLPPEHLAP